MKMNDHTSRLGPVRAVMALAIGLALVVGPLGGCRGERSDNPPRQFFPDLDDQLKVKAQTKNTFYSEFTDPKTGERFGRSMREPVPGTVAFGAKPFASMIAGVDFAKRPRYLQEDQAFYTGRGPDGELIEYMPAEWLTPELFAKGRENFNIYCIVCHGGTGDGDGMVGRLWANALPSFHAEQYQHGGGEKSLDGHIFDVIRNGVPNPGGPYEYRMRPYASKVTVEESWGIVFYIRALQASRRGQPSDLPERERLELERQRGGQAAGSRDAGGDDRAGTAGAVEKEAVS